MQLLPAVLQVYTLSVSGLYFLVPKCLGSTWDDEIRLRNDLFRNHSPTTRPVWNHSTVTVVDIMYHLQSIVGLDERKQTLTTSAFLGVQWTDELLRWDPAKYGGLTDILIDPDEIWKPDITIMNGATNYIDARNLNFLIEIKWTGRTDWSPASVFDTNCPVDVTLYPFDVQTCHIIVATWMHNSEKIILAPKETPNNTLFFGESGEWVFSDSHSNAIFVEYNGGKYSVARISFTFHRRRAFYVINVVVPVLCLSLLNTLVFLVPPQSGEKMSLSVTVLLAYSVFLSLVSGDMPGTSNSVSYLAIYLILVLVAGMVAAFMSALVLRIFHRNGRQLCNGHTEQPLCSGGTNASRRNVYSEPGGLDVFTGRDERIKLIAKIDRISFCVFLGLTLLGFVILISSLLM